MAFEALSSATAGAALFATVVTVSTSAGVTLWWRRKCSEEIRAIADEVGIREPCTRWRAVVVTQCVVGGLGAAVALDLCVGGLGTTNGRAVSFLDSLASCCDYRDQLPLAPRTPTRGARRSSLFHAANAANSRLDAARVFVSNFQAKFLSQSVGSVLLGQTPVILKGPRHLLSWALALAAVQLCPRDAVYRRIREDAAARATVRFASALYKLRKLVFVASCCRTSAAGGNHSPARVIASLALTLLVAVIVIDGNSLLRRADKCVSPRPRAPKAPRPRRESVALTGFFLSHLLFLLAVRAQPLAVVRHGAHGLRGARRARRRAVVERGAVRPTRTAHHRARTHRAARGDPNRVARGSDPMVHAVPLYAPATRFRAHRAGCTAHLPVALARPLRRRQRIGGAARGRDQEASVGMVHARAPRFGVND